MIVKKPGIRNLWNNLKNPPPGPSWIWIILDFILLYSGLFFWLQNLGVIK